MCVIVQILENLKKVSFATFGFKIHNWTYTFIVILSDAKGVLF